MGWKPSYNRQEGLKKTIKYFEMILEKEKRKLTKFNTVLCIGDVILDYYSEGLIERISPEAPIPVLKLLKVKEWFLGEAEMLLRICEAGSKCHLISVVGVDEDSERIAKLCNQEKLNI